MSKVLGYLTLIIGVASQVGVTGYLFYEYWSVFINGQEPVEQQVIIAQSLVVLLLGLTK